jgi:hypothetical protein
MAKTTVPTYMYRMEWIDAGTGDSMWGRWHPEEKLEELEKGQKRATNITNIPIEIGRTEYDEITMLRSVAEFGLYVERVNAQVELDSRMN